MTRPNLLSPASVAASLHTVQQRLYGTRGLHAMVMCFRRTPDGFSRELKRDVRMQLQREQHQAGMVETGAGMMASREQHEQKMQQAKAKPANGGK